MEQEKEYTFGVMSSRFKLKSKNLRTAKIAMIMYLKTSCPIAIYSPDEVKGALDPTSFLKEEMNAKPPEVEDFKKVFATIKDDEVCKNFKAGK